MLPDGKVDPAQNKGALKQGGGFVHWMSPRIPLVSQTCQELIFHEGHVDEAANFFLFQMLSRFL